MSWHGSLDCNCVQVNKQVGSRKLVVTAAAAVAAVPSCLYEGSHYNCDELFRTRLVYLMFASFRRSLS